MSVQSQYNVIHSLSDYPGRHVLFNALAGSMDLIDDQIARGLKTVPRPNGPCILDKSALETLPPDVVTYLDQRGYLWSSADEEKRQSHALYKTMLKFHRCSARQPIVVVPSYNCDLKCAYCWQRLYGLDSPVMTEEQANHLFDVLPEFLDPEAPKVDFTVFGGEPLQLIPALQKRVKHLLQMAADNGFTGGVISNGIGLEENVSWLKGLAQVIQITIDGPKDVHIRTRPLPQGDSWTPMVKGVTKALEAGIHINARVNVNLKNLPRLPELSDFAKEAGWLDSDHFKMHLAPIKNHNPRKETNSEDELLKAVLELTNRDERMNAFDLTGFPGLKYFEGFKQSGLFSLHRFFNCEAQINFFAFDLHGDVFACWDAAGQKHLAIGTYDPEVSISPEKLSQWRDRTSLEIEGCQGCQASPHCGGGCQFLALEHNDTFQASNCDSLLYGYVRAIDADADWLVERAEASDHAVGNLTGSGVKHAVNRPFGMLEEPTCSGPNFAVACP